MTAKIPGAATCKTCHINEASYDGESGGYFNDCEACFELHGMMAPHRHTNTDHLTLAVFVGRVLVGRRCTKHDCGETLPVQFRNGIRVTDYHLTRPTTRETVRTLAVKN